MIPLTTPVAKEPLLQLVAPAVPEKLKLITPLGARALALPVATAVKVIEPPRVGVPVEVRTRVGVAGATVVDVLEVTAATAL